MQDLRPHPKPSVKIYISTVSPGDAYSMHREDPEAFTSWFPFVSLWLLSVNTGLYMYNASKDYFID